MIPLGGSRTLWLLASVAATLMTAALCPAGESSREGDRADTAVATITVRANHEPGPVNPLIFGHNVEAAPSIWGTVAAQTGDGLWDPSTPPGEPVAETVEVARAMAMGMLRYPGGCLVHSFNWKNAVGPLGERPEHTFGLDEFMTYCRAVGAEPLITVSAFVGGPAEAAELVEYLNAPAGSQRPWAQLRAELGHPEPWGARYFEMGNESDHGNHDVDPPIPLTAQQYTDWFNACSARMRAVDPSIKMGALMGTGTGPYDPWNRTVLTGTRETADFITVHTYAVGYWWDQPTIGSDLLMRGCMAAGDQFEALLGEYNAEVLRHRGRPAPLAITEYNAAFVQEEPIRYRFTLGAALFATDYLRILLQPRNNVLMANYWHFVNGYWGLLQGPRTPDEQLGWTEMAAFPLFRLWGSHFGSRLVEVEVEAPRIGFEGVLGVARATDPPLPGGPSPYDWHAEDGRWGPGWQWSDVGDRAMTMVLTAATGEHYAPFTTIAVEPRRTYTLSYDARVIGAVPPEALFGLAMVDGRGYDATGCGIRRDGIEAAQQWLSFRTSLQTLEDTTDLVAVWSLRCGDTPVTVNLEVRNLVIELEPTFPGYSTLTAAASLGDDGHTLYLIVFNKHHLESIEADVIIEGLRLASGRVWVVTGPGLDATNLEQGLVAQTISGEVLEHLGPDGLRHTFPAHSMTAFELHRERVRRPSGRVRPVVQESAGAR